MGAKTKEKKVISYLSVPLPSHENYSKYTAIERRAFILNKIVQDGFPGITPNKRFAELFQKSEPQISKDLRMIKRSLLESIGHDSTLIAVSVYRNAIRSLMCGGLDAKFKAAKVMKMWQDYLFDLGVQQRQAQKVEVSGQTQEKVKITIIEDGQYTMEADPKTAESVQDSQ